MARSGASLKMSFEDELGVLPPVGFFDPLGNFAAQVVNDCSNIWSSIIADGRDLFYEYQLL